jgi:RHS repeat-associated protein
MNATRTSLQHWPPKHVATCAHHARITHSKTLIRYTGRPFDLATDLQNNLNRWYDALVGKWTSEDPIGFGGGDANLYRYVANAASLLSDPAGLELSQEDEAAVNRVLKRLSSYQVIRNWQEVTVSPGKLVQHIDRNVAGQVTCNPGSEKVEVSRRCDSTTNRWHVGFKTLEFKLLFEIASSPDGRDRSRRQLMETILHEAAHKRAYYDTIGVLRASMDNYDTWFQRQYKAGSDQMEQDIAAAQTHLQAAIPKWLSARLRFETCRQLLHLDYLDNPRYKTNLEGIVAMDTKLRKLLHPELDDCTILDSVEGMIKHYQGQNSQQLIELTQIFAKARTLVPKPSQ